MPSPNAPPTPAAAPVETKPQIPPGIVLTTRGQQWIEAFQPELKTPEPREGTTRMVPPETPSLPNGERGLWIKPRDTKRKLPWDSGAREDVEPKQNQDGDA